MNRVRVLIVDDSPTMRQIIKTHLQRDKAIKVVGTAGNSIEAREAVKQLDPDVVTLDIEMPGMSGLEFLDRLMRQRRTPVIMVSSETQAAASATIEALAKGAYECVGKPMDGNLESAFADLPAKVKAAAKAKIQRHKPARAVSPRTDNFRANKKIIAIGSSTGGVEALTAILSNFPANCPPTLITQHMPPAFTKSLATRLDKICAPEVMEAWDCAPIKPGRIYIAPGGDKHLEISRHTGLACWLHSGPAVSGHRPSADVLFRSASALGERMIGVLLTGMGSDGANGLLDIRNAGGMTIGQDENTCVVYGMPRMAKSVGAVVQELPLENIADRLLTLCNAAQEKAA